LRYDVAVVGAGPAGATAAWYLARAGVGVALLERAALPRYKTCGGGLVARARHGLPIDVAPLAERHCHAVVVSLLTRDRAFTCRRTDPLITMTMRATLDHALARAAAEAGAELRASCRVTGVEATGRTVRLRTSTGPVEAVFVVAADGTTGVTARAAGWAPAREAIPALEVEMRVDERTLARFGDAARFDFGIPPGGYAWVFPKASHLSVGVLSTRRRSTRLADWLRAYCERLGIVPHAAERHGYLVPVRPARPPFVRQRTVAVGDAAGLADPLTAEGISHAVLSGRLAAEALVSAELEERRVRARYTTALHREVLPELRVARLLARLVYSPDPIQSAVYRLIGPRIAETVADVAAGTTTYRAALRRPRTYLRTSPPISHDAIPHSG